MSHFDVKGLQKVMNEILLHITIRSYSRLLHYILLKKWEVLTAQIIVFEVEKVVFVGHSNSG